MVIDTIISPLFDAFKIHGQTNQIRKYDKCVPFDLIIFSCLIQILIIYYQKWLMMLLNNSISQSLAEVDASGEATLSNVVDQARLGIY